MTGVQTCALPILSTTVPSHLDISMLHELFHTFGAVPACGNNSDGSGGLTTNHVNDRDTAGQREDLMWGSNFIYDARVLDFNHDDYYWDTLPTPLTGRQPCSPSVNTKLSPFLK